MDRAIADFRRAEAVVVVPDTRRSTVQGDLHLSFVEADTGAAPLLVDELDATDFESPNLSLTPRN
jgi:hypothetical protein